LIQSAAKRASVWKRAVVGAAEASPGVRSTPTEASSR
jgi:hypothetical protein